MEHARIAQNERASCLSLRIIHQVTRDSLTNLGAGLEIHKPLLRHSKRVKGSRSGYLVSISVPSRSQEANREIQPICHFQASGQNISSRSLTERSQTALVAAAPIFHKDPTRFPTTNQPLR